MNERTAKSARLGSGAGRWLIATGTQSQFFGKPRAGRLRIERRASLLTRMFLSPQANPGSFACQQLAPLAFGTEKYTHTPPQALAEPKRTSSPGTSRR